MNKMDTEKVIGKCDYLWKRELVQPGGGSTKLIH